MSKKESQKNLIFAGVQSLLKKPTNQKEVIERKLVLAVSKSLEISPISVVIMGNLPYIDNKGRKELLSKYLKSGYKFEYRWPKRSENDTDKAICEARIVDSKGNPLTDFVVGECSPATIKMRTLNGYQNHIAQTRAENRAFEVLFGDRMRKELYEGLSKLVKNKEITEEEAAASLSAGYTSAEEAVDLQERKFVSQDKNSSFNIILDKILNQYDKKILEEWRKKILSSKNFNENEKKVLIEEIDKKIK